MNVFANKLINWITGNDWLTVTKVNHALTELAAQFTHGRVNMHVQMVTSS